REATGDVTAIEGIGHEHGIGGGEFGGSGHGIDSGGAESALGDLGGQGRSGPELGGSLSGGIGTAGGGEHERDGRTDLSRAAEQFGGRLLQLAFGIGGEDDENGILGEI